MWLSDSIQMQQFLPFYPLSFLSQPCHPRFEDYQWSTPLLKAGYDKGPVDTKHMIGLIFSFKVRSFGYTIYCKEI